MTNNFELVLELSKRQILQKTQGAALGFLWNLLTPLILLGLYTLVFGVIFESRWTGELSIFPYALAMYSGLILFTLWSELITSSAYCIQSWIPLVKKSTVDLRLIPFANVIANYVTFLFNCVPFLVLYLVISPVRKIWFVLFPVTALSLVLAGAAAGLIVAAVSVFFRDIQNILPLVNAAMLFLNPIFFPISALPSEIRTVIEVVSPLVIPISVGRSLLFGTNFPILGTMYYLLTWMIVGYVSMKTFKRLSVGFSDVL